METIGKIRRKKLVEGKGIREISRELRLARNTVRKVLRGEGSDAQYRRATQPAPKLGPYAARLAALIESEARLPKAQRRTAPPRVEPPFDFVRLGVLDCPRDPSNPLASAQIPKPIGLSITDPSTNHSLRTAIR